jgi:hypothetical protein
LYICSMSEQITETKVLADVYENVRNVTRFYIMKSKDIDSFKRYEVNGQQLNSRYWLIGHLVWTEHWLLIQGLANKDMGIPWLEKFSYGSEPSEDPDLPSIEELLEKFKEVHVEAVAAIRATGDEALAEPGHIDFSFGGDKSKRMIIHHAIRHEPCHAGHLGWLCKISGVETF